MKRTHFFHGILLIVLILSFMACKDDHGPIYLVSATDHQQITDGQLEISPFSKGEKFLIRGGEGNYTIKNENKEIVDYRYDGDTLTSFRSASEKPLPLLPTAQATVTH